MSDASRSPSRDRERSQEKPENTKLFVTNLDASVLSQTIEIVDSELQEELKKLLEEYGKISAISVKRSKTGDYSYAFVEFEAGVDGEKAVNGLNGHQLKGKPMKIELQSLDKKRKDPDKGCYNCGKKGHFARECHSKPTSDSRGGYRGRDRERSRHRSRSRSDERHKKKRKRSVSDSRDRDRSKNRKKKEKKDRSRDKSKDRSRDRDEKKKKKHKKHKRSSDRSHS